MKRILTALLAAFVLWAAAPSASQAQGTQGCACLHNRVGQPIHFQYKWGNQPFQTRTLLPGNVYSFCWAYGAGLHTSPPLNFMIDRDAGPGSAWTNYSIVRVQSFTTQCSGVPREGHYSVAFQPGTNNQLLVVHRGMGQAGVPQPPPPQPGPLQPGPGPFPGTGQAAFGCACLNNGVGAPINFQYRWGNQPFQTRTLLPRHVYAFCWNYGTGLHSSPPLHFMLDRDAGPGTSLTDYNIPRVQSPTNQCRGVPQQGQYWVRFQPGTNNQFLHVSR